MDLNNKVIEVINEEHGAKVLDFFKSKGVDTRKLEGPGVVKPNQHFRYYGVLNGKFNLYNMYYINYYKAEIIYLPDDLPKRGDRIVVWDVYECNKEERIFLTFIDGAVLPVQCVQRHSEKKFFRNKSFDTTKFKHWKPIPKEQITELTIKDISDGKGVGIAPHLIRIKNGKKWKK